MSDKPFGKRLSPDIEVEEKLSKGQDAEDQGDKNQAWKQLIAAHAEGVLSDIELKEKLAEKVFNYMVYFSIYVAWVFLLYLISLAVAGQVVPEYVMVTLIGSTFATALGLVAFILKGLFGPSKKHG